MFARRLFEYAEENAKCSLRTARALIFALALITLLAIAYLSNRAWQDYVESRAEGLAPSQATRSNERLLGWMREAETGQRGYLLTGRPEYLAPYRQALSEITADLGQLRASLANYPAQMALFRRLEGLIDQKLAEMLATLATRDTKGPAPTLSIVESGHGQRLMDDIRTVSQQIGAAADEKLTASRNSVRQHTSQARLVTRIGSAILFAILIGAFAANERSSKQRENLIAK